MLDKNTLFLSGKIVLGDSFFDGGILVGGNGKIVDVVSRGNVEYLKQEKDIDVIDVGNYVLMPGIIDSHVHINEPGRTEWEGFETATKAAAAGGITTIVDMPLNSIPPTTTVDNLRTKIKAARGKMFVDVAFWGGVVPGNQEELVNMVNAGVVGFKCFLCPSGVDEFSCVEQDDIEKALQKLEGTNSVLAFHAEIQDDLISNAVLGDPLNYYTFLESRPPSMEIKAIEKIIELAAKYRTKIHIVHLSTALALPLIEAAKLENPNITVETCHHYLTLNAEVIPPKATQFKCCPPIRNLRNQELLWEGLRRDLLTMVVSDHSPSTPDLKLLNGGKNCGDFMKAWGGIASVQFGLSLFWTAAKDRGFTIFDITKYMTRATSELIGLHNRKGQIAKNYDADFVVWDPNSTVLINEAMIQHKNKITPYVGRELEGKVVKTIVRGHVVYNEMKGFSSLPVGNALVNEAIF